MFIRYPKDAGNTYPVHDLVICHGDFLNPARGYIHINDNVPNFGAYGDIMIRDRKMYVVKTPYAVADGLPEQRTLIVPAGWRMPRGFMKVGEVTRHEAKEVAVAYEFDLNKSELRTISERNPNAGRAHSFAAYRTEGGDPTPVVASTQPPRRRRSR